MDKFAAVMSAIAQWFGRVQFSAFQVLMFVLLVTLGVSLIICLVKDEPLWYVKDNGTVYAYCFRRGRIIIKEGEDDVQESK